MQSIRFGQRSDPQPPVEHLLQKRRHLGASQVRSHAGMNAPAEPDVLVVLTVDLDNIGVTKDLGITIGRLEPTDNLVACLDRVAIPFDILGGGATHRSDRSDVAQHLLDRRPE